MFRVHVVLVCVSKGFPPDNGAQLCWTLRSPRSSSKDSGLGLARLLRGAMRFLKAPQVSLTCGWVTSAYTPKASKCATYTVWKHHVTSCQHPIDEIERKQRHIPWWFSTISEWAVFSYGAQLFHHMHVNKSQLKKKKALGTKNLHPNTMHFPHKIQIGLLLPLATSCDSHVKGISLLPLSVNHSGHAGSWYVGSWPPSWTWAKRH